MRTKNPRASGKVYELDGKSYVETGEVRCPRKGEWFWSDLFGKPVYAAYDEHYKRTILRPLAPASVPSKPVVNPPLTVTWGRVVTNDDKFKAAAVKLATITAFCMGNASDCRKCSINETGKSCTEILAQLARRILRLCCVPAAGGKVAK